MNISKQQINKLAAPTLQKFGMNDFTSSHCRHSKRYSLCNILAILLVHILECVASLRSTSGTTRAFIHPHLLNLPNSPRETSRKSINLEMQTSNIDSDYRYKYVHPSIKDVLTKEPQTIPVDFLQAARGVKDDDCILPLLVDTNKATINWVLFEEYIMWKTNNLNNSGTSEVQQKISMDILVTLASQCELAILRADIEHLDLPMPIRGILSLIPPLDDEETASYNRGIGGEEALIATLIALNMVENSIRNLTNMEHGRAPLLKDMIQIMAERRDELTLPNSLVIVLRSLLLPNDGINLRNLLWHGFVPAIHRRWCALSIVLIMSMDDLAQTSSFVDYDEDGVLSNLETLQVMRNHKDLIDILDHGQSIVSCPEGIDRFEATLMQTSFIPTSHKELSRVALRYVHCPVIFASVMGPIIEHSLRIIWCDENQKDKYIAEPGSYFVTLDGHGQRDKHEIVLLPFLAELQPGGEVKEARNQMVYRFGGPTMALLLDIFASPPGAPNIRASVAHGLFNRHLFKELEDIQSTNHGIRNRSGENMLALEDMANALVSILDILTHHESSQNYIMPCAHRESLISSYRPNFSYSAILIEEADYMVEKMKPLYEFICEGRHRKLSYNVSTSMQSNVESKIEAMSQSYETVVAFRNTIYEGFSLAASDSSEFTAENYFEETTSNVIASECGAARQLMSEIAAAASSTLKELVRGVKELESDAKLPSRRRKQISRICGGAELTLNFYSFAAYCALIFIQRSQSTVKFSSTCQNPVYARHKTLSNDILFTAVKRSRMVLSTFSTVKMWDRALKALEQYIAGKAVKAIWKDLETKVDA